MAAALLVALASACSDEPPRPEGLVIWLVDTLRADHLSCYGYGRPTSPVLDALADRGVLFEQFHVQSNWTQPSVTSLLSGRFPPVFSGEFQSGVPEGLTLLPEWLAERGWSTAGFTVTMATAARFGFDRGYDTYEELDWRLSTRERKRREGEAFHAARVVDAAVRWLDHRRAVGRPFLLTLHTVDPHLPYEAHPDLPSFTGPYDGPFDGTTAGMGALRRAEHVFTEEDRQHIIDLYDDQVRYSDAQLGRLMEALAERGLAEDVLLVVVSDHGEELFERGEHGHGHGNVHAELSRVPLVLHWPAGLEAGGRIPGLVQGVDLVPTLCELAGLPAPGGLDGVSRVAQIHGEPGPAEVTVFIDRAKSDVDVMALRSSTELLVVNKAGEASYFDLVRDPDATADVSGRHAPRVGTLVERAAARQRASRLLTQRLRAGEATVELDDEARAALEALGYLGGDGR